jgi:hypothetical protein
MSIAPFKDVDISNINLSKPDKLDNCYICNIKYNDNLLYIQTPTVSIDEITNEYMILNINEQFKEFINNLELNNIKYTYNNCEDWFKKDIPYDAIEHMYENIDVDDNKLKVEFPYIKDKLQCRIFNNDRNNIDISDLSVDNKIVLILHFRGLKILKENFHLDFYINQIKLIDNQYKILNEYSIIDDEEELNDSNIDEIIFDDEIKNAIEQEKLEKQKIKKEKELKQKMKELENELNNL